MQADAKITINCNGLNLATNAKRKSLRTNFVQSKSKLLCFSLQKNLYSTFLSECRDQHMRIGLYFKKFLQKRLSVKEQVAQIYA